MSRIDEALRRAGVPLAEATSAGVGNADVFVSPWATGREAGPHEVPRIPASHVEHHEEPKSEPVEREPAYGRVWQTRDLPSACLERLALSSEADPLLAHQFRRLVATLLQAQGNGKLKTVMITSAAPGDGKTLTALNLAFVLSESYRRRVLLIEADLRRPSICATVGLPTKTQGLSDFVKATDDRKASVLKLTELLTLMPAGRPDQDPLSGLTSVRLERLIQEASEQYDWVIIDTPPIGAAPDAGLIAPLADAVLLVIRAGQTSYANAQQAVETLGADRILGVVLNAVVPEVAARYDDYYGHYSRS